MHVAVIGAGAFGGWTALKLRQSGVRVTLVDALGPGNRLSSSGGESRVLRHAYADRLYVDMACRALRHWCEAARRWGVPLFQQRGVLFMTGGNSFLEGAQAHMAAAGVEFELLDARQLAARYPQMNPEGLERGLFEPAAGFLRAQLACRAVRDALVAEGGEFLLGSAEPGPVTGGEMRPVSLGDGTQLAADQYVFACGPWLKAMFPRLLGQHLKVTRQELYFFRPPATEQGAACADLPVWGDLGERFWYGIPDPEGAFKIGDDTRGPEVDPTTQSRAPEPAGIEAARRYLAHRFPGMRGAELIDSRICQYTETEDGHFIADRHPDAENAWLLGGGSGHGFKHGPVLGERVAAQVLGSMKPDPLFAVRRFTAPAP